MQNKFKYALNGIKVGLITDRSIRLHFLFAFLTVLMGIIVWLTPTQWVVLLLTISMVMVLEYVNSAIEIFANHVHPKQHNAIKKTKDLSAAAVLLASICAFFVGIIIFFPPIFAMLSRI